MMPYVEYDLGGGGAVFSRVFLVVFFCGCVFWWFLCFSGFFLLVCFETVGGEGGGVLCVDFIAVTSEVEFIS